MEEGSKIVIRKKGKKSHAAHHGGSWKVAYADFVTAMMAFFLLLWLLSMVAPEKRIAVSQYFSDHSLFKTESSQPSGTSILDKSTGVLDIERPKPKGSLQGKDEKKATPQELARMMKMAIEDKLQALKNQVLIDTTPEGLRIQIVDNEGSDIFRSGSDEPTEKAVRIIRLVSENIREQPNRIVIEGHTDAAPFKSTQKTNWELATSRASAARRELENNGIDPGRIARVVGYADQELLVPENPTDPRNRRISIILLQ